MKKLRKLMNTMTSKKATESVRDEITVRIVYEGRATKVALHNSKLEEIEKYYEEAAEEGANEHQIEASKKATATMKVWN